MDGQFIFDKLFSDGFMPESRRENELMDKISDFVYKDRESGLFKAKKGAEKHETYDDITLTIKPVVNFLGLFSENNNYSPVLDRKIKTPSVMLRFLGGEAIGEDMLMGHKLGKTINVTIDGYANDGTVEGFRAVMPSEIENLMLGKNKKLGYLATATNKGGKEGNLRFANFSGVRPTMAKLKLGVSTTFGVFYNLDELEKASKTMVIDKAGL